MDWDRLSGIVAWEGKALAPTLAIVAITAGFIAFYFLQDSKKLKQKFLTRYGDEEGQSRWVIFARIFGGFTLGFPSVLLPMLFLDRPLSDFGMGFGMNLEGIVICAVLCPLVVIINILRAGKPGNLVTYPQIRKKEWDMSTFMGSSIGWVIYLLGYELCFRGFLLFACVELMGVWVAIALNCAFYAFAHLFKGIGETVGSIPFGIIISVISLYTGNFMVAFIVHISLALSNQTVAFLAHPDMRWKRG